MEATPARNLTGNYRRRLNTSCRSCRKRKVKCDATEHEACSASTRRRAQTSGPAATPDSLGVDLVGNRQPLSANVPASPPTPRAAVGSSNLSRFFETGIISGKWDGFEENGTFRNVYIGTDVANIHQLIRDHESQGNHYLYYPIPAISETLPWKARPEPTGHRYLSVESINDTSSFPVRPIRDALVETYFNDIHPGFPIIDEASFRQRYADPANPPPLLILQAVLLAAAGISDLPQVAASRAITTAILFRRAKTLFELRHETDRVDLVQAALLLARHTESSDTVASNAYYWVGNAVRIAFGMGLHRIPALPYVPPTRIRFYRKYKKTWWMVLYSEAMLALEHGRPCMVRAEDFDVGLLTEDDFLNMDDSEDHLVNRGFCSVLVDICLAALDVLRLRAPKVCDAESIMSSIEQQLAAVALRIPPTHDVWSCQLRLIYNLVALVHYRTSSEVNAVKFCSEAASDILTTFESMLAQNTIRKCHPSSTMALMGAAIQFAREVRSKAASGSIVTAISAHGQLKRLLAPANTLSPYFANLEAVSTLCNSLAVRAEILIKEHQAQASLATPQALVETGINWEDLMANHHMPNAGIDLDVGDWLNDYAWDNVAMNR
ncbi:fungal-specific transcription factor domain-containing protein [Penicillium capsulatum]|nr:fungal-specific transcription factor domain-containing protein [Penicillium capsulatum]KAJ6113193.1 fungal-specific transcription factor domain-containing protein [Penicillium capsulatum]